MVRSFLFASICLCAAGAYAQPSHNGAGPADEREAAREQRRADLRSALQANRRVEPVTTKGYEGAPSGRHLTARELAEMRQQLRQQQPDGPHFRP